MNYKIIVTLLFVSLSASGCGDPILPSPHKIQNSPNTFQLQQYGTFDHVLKIEVGPWCEGHPITREIILWSIEAKKNIPVHKCLITVGQVPDGFIQTFPKPPEVFSPKHETKYFINFVTSSNSIYNGKCELFIAD